MSDKETELLPCPFCGTGDVKVEEYDTEERDGIIYCASCRCIHWTGSRKEAALNWNTRAAHSEASAWVSVAELVDAVEAVLLVVDRKTDAVDRLKTAVANVKSRTDAGTEKLNRQLEIAMQCVSECEQRSGCQNHRKIKEML